MQKINNKSLYFPIFTLLVFFVYKIIERARNLWYFPLDFTNDISSYVTNLFFLAKYGFHNIAPNWYNGFYPFKIITPAWYYFTLPFYKITNNVILSSFISMILIFILAFIALFYLGKLQKFSITKRIFFFLFFFANPITIGNFIRLGRLPEMFAWLIFILFFIVIIYYKEHEIDKKFIFFIIFYSLLMLSHQAVFVLSSFLILSLFLIKTKKEKIFIALSALISLAITSFWWLPFLKLLPFTRMSQSIYLERIISLDTQWLLTNIAVTIIPIVFLIIFYFYYQNKKSKKELLFFSVPLIMAILLLTKLMIFIPILNQIFPDAYNLFFMFLSIFLFLKTQFSINLRKYIILVLILIPILGIILSTVHSAKYIKHTEIDDEITSLFKDVDGRFLIMNMPNVAQYAHYSYAAIYHNLLTPSGWNPDAAPPNSIENIKKLAIAIEEKDCNTTIKMLNELDTTNIITSNEYYENLKSCNFKELNKTENVCLFSMI